MPNQSVITIYGVDHSPWVQAVIMALELRKRAYRLVSCPPDWTTYRQYGFIMPICQWTDGTVTADSFTIMRELEKRYPLVDSSPPLCGEDQTRLERLFLSYALGRTKTSKIHRFVSAWATMPSGRGASFASCFRAFMCIYFLTLMIGGRRTARLRGYDPDAYIGLTQALSHWSARLKKQAFLGGDTASDIDCAVFGHIQCMTTGLTDEVHAMIRNQPELMAWIERMRKTLFAYDRDFSIRLCQSDCYPKRASTSDRAVYWLTLVGAIGVFPIALLVILDGLLRRNRNPHRTGRRLERN